MQLLFVGLSQQIVCDTRFHPSVRLDLLQNFLLRGGSRAAILASTCIFVYEHIVCLILLLLRPERSALLAIFCRSLDQRLANF